MRKLAWVGVGVALFWLGWWAVLSFAVGQSIKTFLLEQRSADIVTGVDDVSGGKSPLEVRKTLTGLTLADPHAGVSFAAPTVTFSVPTHWPGTMTLEASALNFELNDPFITLAGTFETARGYMHLRPGSALAVEEIRLRAGRLQLAADGKDQIEAEGINFDFVQDPQTPRQYHILSEIQGLTLGQAALKKLSPDGKLPGSVTQVSADLSATFDRRWTRQALSGTTPQLRAIEIRSVDLHWGGLRVMLNGRVAVDKTGIPVGTVRLRVREWERMLAIATRVKIIAPAMQRQARLFLNALSRFGDPPPGGLDLELRFEDGLMWLATIQLGEAPRFFPPTR
ncbi:MAG: DUF2125 domain-containing protein [Pseudomonadota bacterium]